MRLRPRCEAGVPIVFDVQRPPRQAIWHGPKQHCGTCALFGKLAKLPKRPYLSVRVGEATNPGRSEPPPSHAARNGREVLAYIDDRTL